MDSESANFYFAQTQYRTLYAYLRIVGKRMLTGKSFNQLRHGGGCITVTWKVKL